MPFENIETPFDLTLNLGTPGTPCTYRVLRQRIFRAPDGSTENVGGPTIECVELPASKLAEILGAANAAIIAREAAASAHAIRETARAEKLEEDLEAARRDADAIGGELERANREIAQAEQLTDAMAAAINEQAATIKASEKSSEPETIHG